MEIKYLAQENEIQKIYNDLGLIVPVGDLSTTKAPAIQPLPTSSTQTTVTAKFNVMSGADITSLSYKVNDGDAVSLTPAKGVVTITLEGLEYNSGPYEIELTATNATGSTVTSSTIALQHYTNWATADEVLDGNKFIGEDGEEHVGEYVVPEPTYVGLNIAPSTQEQTFDPASEQVDGFDGVTVYGVTSSIDANITAENIKDGVTILGVTGNYQGSGGGQSNYLELQYLDLPSWEDSLQDKYPFGGYVLLNLNDLTIPEGGTVSGNTPPDWVYDMEFIQCYLDAQHNDFFSVDCALNNGILDDPRQLGKAFITSNGTIIIPCSAGNYDLDPETHEQTPNYANIPCGQTNLTGDFEVYAVTGTDESGTPIYGVVATGTYFIPATQAC